MKDRRKRASSFLPSTPTASVFFWCFLLLVFFSGFTFSTLRLFVRERFRPRLVSSWPSATMQAISGESPIRAQAVSIRETIEFPDQVLIFLKYPPSTPLFTKDDIDCIYLLPNSSGAPLNLPPVATDDEYPGRQIVRCRRQPRVSIVTVSLKPNGHLLPGPTYRWDTLAYEAVIDRDNTTIVFVKGLNLRSGKAADPSRFECVYGWDFSRPKYSLRSDVVSIAQEVVRCRTPLSVLSNPRRAGNETLKVSVRAIGGGGGLPSIARPETRFGSVTTVPTPKPLEMCACTMLRNQARFLREWVMYHAGVGVQRWFIYDNNSDDDLNDVIDWLVARDFNITRHVWPWIKTQEAGFAHCALRAREVCEWVGFIDVDEFFHLPSGISIHDILSNQPGEIAELRTSCHNFGPSGLKRVPAKGVTVGYICRLVTSERHKSIVKPEALDSTLINLVHHFRLRDGFRSKNMDRALVVINHYKYQVWEVFKEKFYRRVATYVSDWQEEHNVGSKDRAPGLGTRAVEPADWATRFCEVEDTGLRNRVRLLYADPKTGMLPWQDHATEEDEEDVILVMKRRRRKTSKRSTRSF